MLIFHPCLLDPRAEVTREQMRQLEKQDISLGRLALHLSSEEYASLERLNPDTLGHDDTRLKDLYWKQFTEHPASAPFRVRDRI
jgi:hypothetical protein